MTTRIGLGIGHDEARAVLVRGKRVIWHRSVPLGTPVDVGAIAELLRSVPVPRYGRTTVTAAIGPSAVHVKHMEGLPASTDRSLLSSVVRSAPERFFPKNGIPLVLPDVYVANDGVLGAAFDEPVVAAVREACRMAGLVLDATVPSAIVLHHALLGPHIAWLDGNAAMTVTRAEGGALRIERLPPALVAIDSRSSQSVPALSDAKADLRPYADAYGAARVAARAPLALRETGRREALRRATRVLAAAMVALSAIGAVAAPSVAAHRAAASGQQRATALRGGAAEMARTTRELNQATTTLERIGSFSANRRSAVRLIGALAQVLPESTAIISLRADSIGGSLSLLSTNAAGALAALSEVDAIESVQLSGALTREMAGPAQLERFSIRFRFRGTVVRRPGKPGEGKR